MLVTLAWGVFAALCLAVVLHLQRQFRSRTRDSAFTPDAQRRLAAITIGASLPFLFAALIGIVIAASNFR